MNIPPDDHNAPPPGLGFDPNLAMSGDVSLTGQNKSKLPLVLVGLLLAGGGGFLFWQSKKHRDDRVKQVKFMEEFQQYEKDDLVKFWECTLGPKADGTTMQSPDIVTAKIDVMFASDFKAYPLRVGDECATIAKEVASKANSLVTLPEYTSAVDAYSKSIVKMSDALGEWAKAAPAQVEAKMVQKNVGDYASAWRGYTGGAPAKEVMGYDQFLHCAVPDADTKYKDDLALATAIFEQCKQPGYADKLNAECGKLLITDQTAPTKSWKTALQKFAPDTDAREQQAFDSCMRKGRKGKVKDNLVPFGQAWVDFRTARDAVLKIGQDALKE
jgi:LPXTG-motif cell wall-anchored protein